MARRVGGAGSREGQGGEDTLTAPVPAPLPPQPRALGSHASLRRGTAGRQRGGPVASRSEVRGANGGPGPGEALRGTRHLLGVPSLPPCAPSPQPSLGDRGHFPRAG